MAVERPKRLVGLESLPLSLHFVDLLDLTIV
jgi:hypothetical protein